MWCPYTNDLIKEASVEHVIPLSLGGSDHFTIAVNRDINSKLGSEIDAVLANDLMILFQRRALNARGHSGKEVKVVAKNAKFLGRPVQVTFQGKDPPVIWDAISRSTLQPLPHSSASLEFRWTVPIFSRLRFAAKAALAAGWFAFGDFFRSEVAHDELRQIMLCPDYDSLLKVSQQIGTRLDGGLITKPDTSIPAAEVINYICSTTPGSCILITASDSTICFSIGILGGYLASLNVPANLGKLDFNEFDLGQCFVCCDGALSRMSFRQLAKETLDKLNA